MLYLSILKSLLYFISVFRRRSASVQPLSCLPHDAMVKKSPKAKSHHGLAVASTRPAKERAGAAAASEAPREPQQDRGQRRVEEILDAADAVIGEVGWDAATTQLIIDRAGASMGSFFHFFPSRTALLEALARRHAARMFAINEEAMPMDAVHLPPDELFERIVRGQARYAQTAPALRAIHEAAARTFGTGGPFRELDEAIYERVRLFVATRLPGMDRAACEACVRLSVATVHSAVEIAMSLPPAQREQVLNTARNMLARYVESLDAQHGQH